MSIAGIYEVIAATALIIVGIFVAYDGMSSMVWGALMILLGVLILIFRLAGLG